MNIQIGEIRRLSACGLRTLKIYGKVEIEGTTRSIGAVSSEAVELRRQHLEKRGKI